MKIILRILVLIAAFALLFFLVFLGYNKYYGVYWKSDVNSDELESYAYVVENFSVSISSANVGHDTNGYYVEFSAIVKNNSPEFLNSVTLIPKIELKTGKNKTDEGYQEIGLNRTEILYGKVLNAGEEMNVSKKLYFSDPNSYEGFNTDKLRYDVQTATLKIGIDGKNSTGYEISKHANVNYYNAKFDLTSQWESIRKV